MMLRLRSLNWLIKRTAFGCGAEYPRTTDGTFRQKAIRVAILGAESSTGELVAFLLKQNPIVAQIYLHGDITVHGLAADLRHMDTRCEVFAHHGPVGISSTVRCADIVLLIGVDKVPIHATAEERLRSEMDRLVMYAKACTIFAPRSLIGVCVRPISCTFPIVSDIFRGTHWYHPGRIIGCASLMQTRVNAYVGNYYGLDPNSVHVPFVGGPDTDNVVPLFSRARPVQVLRKDGKALNEFLKNWKEAVAEKCKTPIMMVNAISEAYAINRFVTTLSLGLCGDDYAVSTAYIRQNIIKTCRYLVTTVKFGPGGVVHNFGVPVLTKDELKALETTVIKLDEREQMALKVFAMTTKPPEPEIAERMLAKSYMRFN
ncbi:probable malate dehydrogenase, mitochondrial [Photinus pyralis]|nr:probable malate dehydrogenase, mitochondrial [Photinus pyralis]